MDYVDGLPMSPRVQKLIEERKQLSIDIDDLSRECYLYRGTDWQLCAAQIAAMRTHYQILSARIAFYEGQENKK